MICPVLPDLAFDILVVAIGQGVAETDELRCRLEEDEPARCGTSQFSPPIDQGRQPEEDVQHRIAVQEQNFGDIVASGCGSNRAGRSCSTLIGPARIVGLGARWWITERTGAGGIKGRILGGSE